MAISSKKTSKASKKQSGSGDSVKKKQTAATSSSKSTKNTSAGKSTKKTSMSKKTAAGKKTVTEKSSVTGKKTTSAGKKETTGRKAAERKTARPKSPSEIRSGMATGTSKISPARLRKLKYKQGQEIVYPLQGVGQVKSIEERTFRDGKLLYYIIYLEVSDMTIMVPVDKADELGIRSIVDKRQANKALKLISEEYEPVPTDWKARYQNNLDLLKKGSVLDIATVVRALYHRSRIKELPILERKLYDSALKLLVDEISFSLQKGKDEVEELVISKMEVN